MKGELHLIPLFRIGRWLVFFLLLFSSENDNRYHTRRGWRLEKDLLGRLLRFGFPSGVQFFLEIGAFTGFVLVVGRLGTASLAATNIAFNISIDNIQNCLNNLHCAASVSYAACREVTCVCVLLSCFCNPSRSSISCSFSCSRLFTDSRSRSAASSSCRSCIYTQFRRR